MEVSKIHLSPSELDLFCNEEFILTKNRIIQKTITLLNTVQDRMLEQKPAGPVFSVSPKITRGENYLGLPFVILDFPRMAQGKDIFFIRSMFWWGHFFSSTLHVSGSYARAVGDVLQENYSRLAAADYYIGINTDPWVHHFSTENYKRIIDLSADEFRSQLLEQDHIKIAAKWPLSEWDLAATKLFNSWKMLAGLVT